MSLSLFNGNRRVYRNDPFALARELFQWEPLLAVPAVRTAQASELAPAFNASETEDAYRIEADLPGVKEDQLDITLDGNKLTVSGARSAQETKEGESYHVTERRYGSFSRTFTLPRDVNGDAIEAKLDAGVLTLVVPKRPESKARKIAIK